MQHCSYIKLNIAQEVFLPNFENVSISNKRLPRASAVSITRVEVCHVLHFFK